MKRLFRLFGFIHQSDITSLHLKHLEELKLEMRSATTTEDKHDASVKLQHAIEYWSNLHIFINGIK